MKDLVEDKVRELKNNWDNNLLKLDKEKLDFIKKLEDKTIPISLKDIFYDLPDENKESTRVASGKILNLVAYECPLLLGGSADVASSTYALLNSSTFSNRSISFGVREHAMGAIANGIALSGLIPFVSTFLTFSDYLKPAIRMTSMMNLNVLYLFSHDSISVGEDGPTHEPVEQLIGLRSIPNLDVYRPADINETIGVYKNVLLERRPSAIILGRNKVEILDSTSINDIKYGAYTLKKEEQKLDAVLIATGEEVSLACDIVNDLKEKGYGIRLVSMPSIECFSRQSKKYQNSIIPENSKVFVLEASSSYSWDRFTKREYMFTVDSFGKSGSKEDVFKNFEFTKMEIVKKMEKLLK